MDSQHCSGQLSSLVPRLPDIERSTRSANRSHNFTAICNHKLCANSLFSRNSRFWDFFRLPASMSTTIIRKLNVMSLIIFHLESCSFVVCSVSFTLIDLELIPVLKSMNSTIPFVFFHCLLLWSLSYQ